MPSTNPDLRIGAAYIRVSTDDQLEYSPESQLEKIQGYAKANGIIVPEEYIFMEEEGRSGRSTKKRTEFNRMIGTAKLKPKPFDVLLLWKFSRFARSREDSILYKSMLRRDLGIEVVSVSEPIGEDKMSILIEAMIEAMDEYYSINLAEEVRRGMTQRAKAGRPNTYAPIGYRMQDGAYIPDPDTAPIVRKIYEDFVGGRGLLQISHELTALGVRSRFGNPIDNRGIKYILRNPVYIGKVRWTPTGRTRRVWDNPDTITMDGGHEPLVPCELYDQAQTMLDERERRHGRYAREDGKPFALKGLVRCSGSRFFSLFFVEDGAANPTKRPGRQQGRAVAAMPQLCARPLPGVAQHPDCQAHRVRARADHRRFPAAGFRHPVRGRTSDPKR